MSGGNKTEVLSEESDSFLHKLSPQDQELRLIGKAKNKPLFYCLRLINT